MPRKLGAAQPSWRESMVSPNSILFKTSNIKPRKLENLKIKHDFKEVINSCVEKSESMKDFRMEDVENAMKLVKSGKAAGVDGVDGVLPEFLKYLGLKSKAWLASFFSSVKNNNVLPKLWRESKVIAITNIFGFCYIVFSYKY